MVCADFAFFIIGISIIDLAIIILMRAARDTVAEFVQPKFSRIEGRGSVMINDISEFRHELSKVYEYSRPLQISFEYVYQ